MEKQVTDMMGRKVVVPISPKRIVSLVPSQTELLYDLGLRDEVVGITRFCEYPSEWHRSKKRVGGTKDIHMDRVLALQPDLVIANKEENTKEMVECLAEIAPVWVSDVRNLSDAQLMISHIGQMVQRQTAANSIVETIQSGFSRMSFTELSRPLKVLYVIWKNPWMAVSGDTFIGDMLRSCGFINVFENHPDRYPFFSLMESRALQPDVVFLSSEPFPFKEIHVEEWEQQHPKMAGRVLCVDGSLFSWYGSRLTKSAPYFASLVSKITV